MARTPVAKMPAEEMVGGHRLEILHVYISEKSGQDLKKHKANSQAEVTYAIDVKLN